MASAVLNHTLYQEFLKHPLLDPHSHIEPHSAASKSLEDILGYHYYTELAHSAGMSQAPLQKDVSPRERVRAILGHMDRFDNTAQYSWFVEIAQTFLGFQGKKVTEKDADTLFDTAEKKFAEKDWEEQVWKQTNLDAIFLTNEFDDPLEGFDTKKYVPCLRTDTLVFRLASDPTVKERLAKVTGIEVTNASNLREALNKLFLRFKSKGAKACAISLPPDFQVVPDVKSISPVGVFWALAEACRDHKLPFDLMIGVNRKVYRNGVFQGQDLFDQRTSLLNYVELFNAFPEVTFPISVLTSVQNQELVSHAWIFPNVVTSGHWWYSNIPTYIENDLRARLQAVPRNKQIGYYSDAYKLEFVLPKFNMYRRILAKTLAQEYVEPGIMNETQAVELGKQILRGNSERIFGELS
jgi:glucuronate isomerase